MAHSLAFFIHEKSSHWDGVFDSFFYNIKSFSLSSYSCTYLLLHYHLRIPSFAPAFIFLLHLLLITPAFPFPSFIPNYISLLPSFLLAFVLHCTVTSSTSIVHSFALQSPLDTTIHWFPVPYLCFRHLPHIKPVSSLIPYSRYHHHHYNHRHDQYRGYSCNITRLYVSFTRTDWLAFFFAHAASRMKGRATRAKKSGTDW